MVGLLQRVGKVGGTAAVQERLAVAVLGRATDAGAEFGQGLHCEREQ